MEKIGERLRLRGRHRRQKDSRCPLSDFGWDDESIVDLGGIASARGPEHYFLMFAALMQSLGTPRFNIRLVS